jgi:hypothetical protein
LHGERGGGGCWRRGRRRRRRSHPFTLAGSARGLVYHRAGVSHGGASVSDGVFGGGE